LFRVSKRTAAFHSEQSCLQEVEERQVERQEESPPRVTRFQVLPVQTHPPPRRSSPLSSFWQSRLSSHTQTGEADADISSEEEGEEEGLSDKVGRAGFD